MGKRKKSSRKPGPTRKKEPLETNFMCLFCHHDKSVTVKIDRKEGVAQLQCKICGQRFQGKVNHLTEPIDVYSNWIDEAENVQREGLEMRRGIPSSSRSAPILADLSDDD